MNKKDLRKIMLSKRNVLSSESIFERSEIILERFYQSSLYKDAKKIMTYVPFQRELRTDLLIQRSLADGKEIYIPVTVPKEKKTYSVKTPGSEERFDCRSFWSAGTETFGFSSSSSSKNRPDYCSRFGFHSKGIPRRLRRRIL